MGTVLEIGLGLAAGAAVVGGVIWYRRRQQRANILGHRAFVEAAAAHIRGNHLDTVRGYPL